MLPRSKKNNFSQPDQPEKLNPEQKPRKQERKQEELLQQIKFRN
jgi:hypothetical protein